MYAAVLLLGACAAVAASVPHASFYYEMSSSLQRVDDGCRVCYKDDCLMLNDSRCEYFMEVDEVMDSPERDGGGSAIDAMVAEMTEQATMSWLDQECIPLISQYTTCNKENICFGCKTCQCSPAGKWNCALVHRCRAESSPVVDHSTLVSVMETLLEFEKKSRKKRLVENITDELKTKPIDFMDITEWIYGDRENATDLTTDGSAPSTVPTNKDLETTSTTKITSVDIPTESEYLGFEDVLKNIAHDQIYKRRKAQLYENSDLDYIDLDDVKSSWNTTSENFMKMLNDLEQGDNVTETSVTNDDKFVVDLYPRDYEDYNVNEDGDANNTIDMIPANLDLNPVNIVKRDISFNDVNGTTHDTTVVLATIEETTQMNTDIEKDVLKPLTNIINDRENEVKALLKIRQNLINIIEAFHNRSQANTTKKLNYLNGNSTHVSIYKLNLYPEIHENLRKINPDVLSKLLYKLKRDIYEVFRDISQIQKLSDIDSLPDDLRLLIRSMKHYVSKQGGINDLKKNIELHKNNIALRAQITVPKNPTKQRSIVQQLVEILETVDKDTTQSNDYANSSGSSKKLIKRLIKQYYVDGYSQTGHKMYDSEYNITNDIKTVGKSWAQQTAKLATSPSHEKLYALKLFHLTLSQDINKLNDVMNVIDFAHSRRMTPIETPKAEHLLERIAMTLQIVKYKLHSMFDNQIDQKNGIQKRAKVKKTKKHSFLKKIRNMLKSSKHEIIGMVKKKVPKTEIFKHIAKRKFNELTRRRAAEDEDTMLKWKKALSLERKKRDLATHIKTMKSRMKNIIPNYLRGKINGGLFSKYRTRKQSGVKKNGSKHKTKTSLTGKPKIKSTSQRTKVKVTKTHTKTTKLTNHPKTEKMTTKVTPQA